MNINLIDFIRKIKIKCMIKNCGKGIKVTGKVYIKSKNIHLGNDVQIQPGVMIFGNGKVEIGDNTVIGKDTIIFSNKNVKIGKNVLIAAQSYIIDSNHQIFADKLINQQGLESEVLIIGDDVWIGAGAKVIKGSRINEGAVIGAMSLVNNNVDSYSINIGIPTRKIGERKIVN